MTLQEAKLIARHLGLSLRKVRSGSYRVNFCDGKDYTDNLEEAVNTAVAMARTRDLMKGGDKPTASGQMPSRISNRLINTKSMRPIGDE